MRPVLLLLQTPQQIAWLSMLHERPCLNKWVLHLWAYKPWNSGHMSGSKRLPPTGKIHRSVYLIPYLMHGIGSLCLHCGRGNLIIVCSTPLFVWLPWFAPQWWSLGHLTPSSQLHGCNIICSPRFFGHALCLWCPIWGKHQGEGGMGFSAKSPWLRWVWAYLHLFWHDVFIFLQFFLIYPGIGMSTVCFS